MPVVYIQDQVNKLNGIITSNAQMVYWINNTATLKQQFIDYGYAPGVAITGMLDATITTVNAARTGVDLTAYSSSFDAMLLTLTQGSRTNWKAIEAFLP